MSKNTLMMVTVNRAVFCRTRVHDVRDEAGEPEEGGAIVQTSGVATP